MRTTHILKGMIESFKSKNLEKWWSTREAEEPDKPKPIKVPPKAAKKLKALLFLMHGIRSMQELKEVFSAPGYNLQKYKAWGDRAWEVRISGNYRVLFCFDPITADITDIKYTDETH